MLAKRLIGALTGLLACVSIAFSADNYFPTPGGAQAPGFVSMCLNAAGHAVPTSSGQCASGTYNAIAASQTAQALTGGDGGATGDYLSHCTVVPTSTSPGVVTISDNGTPIISFPGGSSSLSNLVPFPIIIGAVSINGAWKITTGANVSVVCVGKFT